ncbi:MAG: DNA repair exonuclease [Acidobacteria bacterium]|nr:DNA repair exonuclease [Acidobacteriota bacterium]
MIRLLHTADVHLGRTFRFLGDFGKTLRAQVRDTFGHVMRLARDRQVHAVLIPGDLFDSLRPDPAEVRFALDAIASADPVPVFLLPGTHDLFAPNTLYRRLAAGERPRNLYLFDPEHRTFYLGQLGLAVHGRANEVRQGGTPPLTGILPHAEARFNVALAHASIALPHLTEDPGHDHFVSEAEVRAAGVQYLALGHWHKCAEYFSGNAFRAWYAGSPETLQFEDNGASGYVLEVSLREGGVEVHKQRVGRYTWIAQDLDVTAIPDRQALEREILSLAGDDHVARVVLTGTRPAEAAFDVAALQETLAPRFAYFELNAGGLRTRWEDFDPTRLFPRGTVGAAFVTLAKERLAAASDEERAHWEEVLRRGAALLAGAEGVGA